MRYAKNHLAFAKVLLARVWRNSGVQAIADVYFYPKVYCFRYHFILHPPFFFFLINNINKRPPTLIDETDPGKGVVLEYSGGVGGRKVQFILTCDPTVDPLAGPEAAVGKSMVYAQPPHQLFFWV